MVDKTISAITLAQFAVSTAHAAGPQLSYPIFLHYIVLE